VGVRALIFDFDGLLLETEGALFESWRELYAMHGIPLSLEEWASTIGTAGGVEPMEELERRCGRRLDREWLHAVRRTRRDELLDSLEPCDGVIEVTKQALDLGLAMAVASSSPPEWVDTHLRRLGLRDLFGHLSCFEGTGAAKPSPDLYLGALGMLGAVPEEVIAFEDSHNGLLAAKAACLRCVVVPSPMTMHMDFQTADMVLARLGDPPLAELISALERPGATR